MARFNGHRNWNAWNVHLWLTNDETLYSHACELVWEHGKDQAAEMLAETIGGDRTPDGAVFNKTAIREALKGL